MMGMLPNPMRDLETSLERRSWTLLILIAVVVVVILALNAHHGNREDALEKRIEAIEKERAGKQ